MVDWIRLRDSAQPSVWAGIGVVGILVFLLGIYSRAWKGLPAPGVLEDVVAIVGGGLAVFGFSLAWDAHQAIQTDPRRRPLPANAQLLAKLGPSVEIYRPPPRTEEPPQTTSEQDEP